MMWPVLKDALDSWASLYSHAPVLRTTVGFAHVGGLVVSGGWAITTDRAIIGTSAADVEMRRQRLRQLHSSHAYVIVGLFVVVVSGLLLLAADTDTYLSSTVFWTKMAAIALLGANGAWLRRAGWRADEDPAAWPLLRRRAMASMILWGAVTALGAALPNVS
jgi:hypothetical protein